jgi:hypothetical protein
VIYLSFDLQNNNNGWLEPTKYKASDMVLSFYSVIGWPSNQSICIVVD